MNEDLLRKMREGERLSVREQVLLVFTLSIPAILAQISTIIMQYIDASMVGCLDPDASAAVGLVVSTTWLTGGLCQAVCTGFTVRVAYRIGAGNERKARETVKYGVISVLFFSLCLMAIVLLVHRSLPIWIGGEPQICRDASRYFLIYGFSLPFLQMVYICGGMLQCSGDMKTPGILNILMCFLDIVFNFLLIFPCRTVNLHGISFFIPGAGLGVTGAALGTALAALCCAFLLIWNLLFRSSSLHLRKEESGSGLLYADVVKDMRVSVPVMASAVIMGLAYIAGTHIVAPLGTIAIAANSFAVTAESICFMPCYGLAAAATTCVGQAKGAEREPLMKRFGYLSVGLGMAVMVFMAFLLYLAAPYMMAMLSPDPAVREAGTRVLRIIVYAEPLFGASIVAEGVFRGLGRTRIPTVLILLSMWCIRIPLCLVMASRMGLTGVWIAEGIELCIRGLIFIVSLIKVNRQSGRKLDISLSEQ
ncbi:MAG: MATE family efflux transporter [Eubacterium sp.]|nr:MATE family efflux transporter [Eubacterium sp.]